MAARRESPTPVHEASAWPRIRFTSVVLRTFPDGCLSGVGRDVRGYHEPLAATARNGVTAGRVVC